MNPYRRKLSKDELLALLPGVTGLIAGLEPLTRDVLAQSSLKVISRCGVGVSNVDLEAARDLGIAVRITPDAPTLAVAELTVGAMLALLRRIPEMDRDLHQKKWNRQTGSQLTKKTVAIVGFGRIGRKVADFLRPFDVRLLVVDPAIKAGEANVEVVTLDQALRESMILSLHASGESQLIGARELATMSRGSILLNAGRGGLVDEAALAEALKTGHLAGAWIDTFGDEPYSGSLCDVSRALLTPHAGSATQECRSRMESEAVENLLSALKGTTP